MKKKCCSNLQARNDFLQISKPAGIRWEHLLWETAQKVLFFFINLYVLLERNDICLMLEFIKDKQKKHNKLITKNNQLIN